MSKPLRSQPARDRILAAARRLFAEEGYDRTTIRMVAAAAEINPSLVMRYYGNKEGLLAAAADFDLALPDLSKVSRDQLGETMVRHFLKRWEARHEELPALLRVAATHEQARDKLLELFAAQVAPTIARVCGPKEAPRRAALMATQTLGLAFTRYVLRLPPVVALTEDEIVRTVGATIQRYLVDDI
jgi:AcrR family transcriptional regulator